MADWKTPDDLKYAKSDEWVRIEGDTATIGISDYAQDALNDIVYVEFPDVGTSFDKGDSFGSLESVKAASDIYAPIGGTVTEVNDALSEQPELINTEPYKGGWLFKVRPGDQAEVEALLSAEQYEELVPDEG